MRFTTFNYRTFCHTTTRSTTFTEIIRNVDITTFFYTLYICHTKKFSKKLFEAHVYMLIRSTAKWPKL